MRRWQRGLAGLTLISVLPFFACGFTNAATGAPTASGDITSRIPVVSAVTDAIGKVGRPAHVSTRDGGASALIGGKLLWAFGDTLLSTPAVDGASLRCDTAALADPAAPTATSEPLDANGDPAQFIPFTAAELAYNQSKHSSSDRYALWPTSVIADGAGNGLVFFSDELVQPGTLNYLHQGIGTASVAPNSTTATRDQALLFAANEPSFTNAMVRAGMVYLYGARTGGQVVLARAPLANARSRAAYTFWSANQWDSDVTHATTLFDNVPGAVSVSFNPYLRSFLSVTSGNFLFHPNAMLLRTAHDPQGPWSAPIVAFTGVTPASGIDYAGIEHPELALNGGRTVRVTYYNPTGAFTGDLRLVELTFA